MTDKRNPDYDQLASEPEPTPQQEEHICECCGHKGDLYTGPWLRWFRLQARISMNELSRRSGLSVPLISLVESGERTVTPRVEHAYITYIRDYQL